MKRILKALHGAVTRHVGWKLLSLAIAVVLWAVVATEPELSTFASVPVEYKNLPDGLEINSPPVTSILLELRGPSGELRGLGDGGVHPAVVLDMSSARPGQRTFPIGDSNVKLARGVRLVHSRPSEVRFDFEPRAQRPVPVVVRFTGEGKNGYVVAHSECVPAELWIAGPSSRVARVVAAVTDPVDVSTMAGSSRFSVNAFLEDPYVRFQSSPQVSVDVTMRKKAGGPAR
ncbi:MAG: hypothetical protein LAP87_24730 [Acidobacteriia bacterium]|nr:hypothetical protein [Terriglobia bacterium]